MVAAASGVRMFGHPDDNELDRRRAAMMVHSRVYRALRRMADGGDGHHVTVLFRLFGPGTRAVDASPLGPLAPIATYTATGEAAARAVMARHPGMGGERALETALRVASVPAGAERQAHEARRAAMVQAILSEATAIRDAAVATYRAARRGAP
jgi:hypothetical protein